MKDQIVSALKIVTPNYYMEEVSKDRAIAKIKQACEDLEVPFHPDLISFWNASIFGGSTLTFYAKVKPISNITGIGYGHPKFGDLIKAYESAKFKLDRKWFDVDKMVCNPLYYTQGIDVISTLNAINHLDSNHFLKGVRQLEKLILEGLTKEEQINLIYFS